MSVDALDSVGVANWTKVEQFRGFVSYLVFQYGYACRIELTSPRITINLF